MSEGTADSPIPPEALAMIGSEAVVDIGPVTSRDILRYAAATGDGNPLYCSPQEATDTAYGGVIAPPSMLSAIFWSGDGVMEDALSVDGLVKGDSVRVPLRVKRAMGGGQELEFFEPVRPGDVITRTDRLAEVYERESRLGTLVFTVTEQTFRNQRGEIVMTCRSTSIMH